MLNIERQNEKDSSWSMRISAPKKFETDCSHRIFSARRALKALYYLLIHNSPLSREDEQWVKSSIEKVTFQARNLETTFQLFSLYPTDVNEGNQINSRCLTECNCLIENSN